MTGYTAIQAAEILVPDAREWRRRDTIRRRVQELQEPYRLLEVIGVRPGASTHKDNQVYAVTDLGREAFRTWQEGKKWRWHPLARPDDPATSAQAARDIRPDKDFHKIITLFVRFGG